MKMGKELRGMWYVGETTWDLFPSFGVHWFCEKKKAKRFDRGKRQSGVNLYDEWKDLRWVRHLGVGGTLGRFGVEIFGFNWTARRRSFKLFEIICEINT